MNLNKALGRVATTLVAGAMLTALAMPAYAEPTTPADTSVAVTNGVASATSGTSLTKIKLTKKLVLPDDVTTPTQTFNFTVTPATDASGTIKTSGVEYSVWNGPTGTSTTGSASVNSSSSRSYDNYSGTTDTDVVTTDLILDLPSANAVAAEKGAGIYKYKIDEQNFSADSDYYEVTGAGLDLYLIVERANSGNITENETYEISGVIVYPHGTAPDGLNDSAKTSDYVNYYKLAPNGNKKVNSMSFTKKVAGAMGNKNDTFTFEVAVPGVAEGTTYKYDRSGITANAKTNENVAVADGKLTFTNVGHNETVTVKGLDIDTTYVITETNPGTYNVSTDSNDQDSNLTDNKASLKIKQDTVVTTTFTNTRVAVSPTGIVMNVAPYVLLVVVAAAGCFVFLRKRRED